MYSIYQYKILTPQHLFLMIVTIWMATLQAIALDNLILDKWLNDMCYLLVSLVDHIRTIIT